MLSKHAIETSLPLTDKLTESGYAIQPVLGSPLSKLVASTAITNTQLGAPEPGVAGINSRLMSEVTDKNDEVTGYCEHDISMREVNEFTVGKLMAQISYARNDGAGAIEELAENVQAHIDSLPPFAETGAQIIVREIPKVLVNESLLEEIQASHAAPRYDVALEMRLPEKNASEIRTLMRTGLPSLDDEVSEYIADIGDEGLVSVWASLFMELSPLTGSGKAGTNLSHFITGEQNLKTAVIVFLLARRLSENIIDGTNMSESQYMRVVSDYRVQAAARICDVMALFAAEERNGQLILGVQGLKVTVNGVMYRKYLTSGGSSDALLGSLIFREGSVTVDKLLENRERYEAGWHRQYAMNRQTFDNMRFSRIKEILILEYVAQTNNTSGTDFPLHERELCMALVRKLVNELTIDEVDNITMVCLKLLGKSRFRNRNVYDILSTVASVRKKNPNVSAPEAASIAIIEYIARWMASMMVISKNGKTLPFNK